MNISTIRQTLLRAMLFLLPIAAPAAAQESMITAGFQMPLPLPSIGYMQAVSSEIALGAGVHLIPLEETVYAGAYGQIRYTPSGNGFDAFHLTGNFSWMSGVESSYHMLGSITAGWQWALSDVVSIGLEGGLGAWYDSRWHERDPRFTLGDGPVVPMPVARMDVGVLL